MPHWQHACKLDVPQFNLLAEVECVFAVRPYAQYCGCGLTAFAIELWPRSLIKWFWRVGALWSLQLKLSGVACPTT